MPDNKITVSMDLQDDLTPKLNEVKKGLSQLQETETWGHGFKELSAGIGYEIGLWNVGFMAAAKATELLGTAIKMAFSEPMAIETAQVALKNFNLGIEDTVGEVQALEGISKQTKIATKDLFPSVETLEGTGEGIRDINHQIENLGKIADITGTPIQKLAEFTANLTLGRGGFEDLFKYAQSMGSDIKQMAIDYNQMSVDAPAIAYNEKLAAEDFHRHMEDAEREASLRSEMYHRAVEDQQRLTSARDQFLGKSGFTTAAFQSYVSGSAVHLPSAFQGINTNELIRKMTAEFQAGEREMSQELGLSIGDIRALERGGGITGEDLIAGHQRGMQAQTTMFDRSMQDDHRLREEKQISYDRELQNKQHLREVTEAQAKFDLMAAERQYMLDPTEAQRARVEEQYQNWQDTVQSTFEGAKTTIADTMSHAGDSLQRMKEWSKPFEPGKVFAPGEMPTTAPTWLDPRVREQWERLQTQGYTGTAPNQAVIDAWMKQTSTFPVQKEDKDKKDAMDPLNITAKEAMDQTQILEKIAYLLQLVLG